MKIAMALNDSRSNLQVAQCRCEKHLRGRPLRYVVAKFSQTVKVVPLDPRFCNTSLLQSIYRKAGRRKYFAGRRVMPDGSFLCTAKLRACSNLFALSHQIQQSFLRISRRNGLVLQPGDEFFGGMRLWSTGSIAMPNEMRSKQSP